MGIDMHAAGLSASADYAMLEMILGLAVRKETGSSNPVIRINKGQTFVVKKVRKLFKEMISKGNLIHNRKFPCTHRLSFKKEKGV